MNPNKSQPHGGLLVTRDYNEFARTEHGLTRLVDLKCIGCGTVWERVAPLEHKPTAFCDDCDALLQACNAKAQELWNAALANRKHPEERLPQFQAGHNTGVYALRDLLFAHARGAGELSRWDQRRLANRFHYEVKPFGSRTV